MQIEFNNNKMEFQSKYVFFPAFEIDLESAEDLKTTIMSDMVYKYEFDNILYSFEPKSSQFVKIIISQDNLVVKYLVTLDSLFRAIDDIVYYEDNENDDPNYELEEDMSDEDDEFYE